jgi:hypothetical protein
MLLCAKTGSDKNEKRKKRTKRGYTLNIDIPFE